MYRPDYTFNMGSHGLILYRLGWIVVLLSGAVLTFGWWGKAAVASDFWIACLVGGFGLIISGEVVSSVSYCCDCLQELIRSRD